VDLLPQFFTGVYAVLVGFSDRKGIEKAAERILSPRVRRRSRRAGSRAAALRKDGQNMLDRMAVQLSAMRMGYSEVAWWIAEHPQP